MTGSIWLRPARPVTKIRQFFKNQDKELSINKGREMLISQLQENGYVANKFMDKRHMDEVLQKTSYKTEEALFAAIGFGEIGAITVFNRLTEKDVVKKSVPRLRQKQKNWSRVAKSR